MYRNARLAALATALVAPLLGSANSRVAVAAEAAISPSKSFTIAGAVQTPKTYKRADLLREPVTTETVYFSTGAGPVQASYTGVLLWTLLQEVGIKANANIKNDILRHTVTLTATDGYQVVISAGEIDPAFGGEQAIVAYDQDGKPLTGTTGGFARLVMPGDKAGGRAVQSITRIEVQ